MNNQNKSIWGRTGSSVNPSAPAHNPIGSRSVWFVLPRRHRKGDLFPSEEESSPSGMTAPSSSTAPSVAAASRSNEAASASLFDRIGEPRDQSDHSNSHEAAATILFDRTGGLRDPSDLSEQADRILTTGTLPG